MRLALVRKVRKESVKGFARLVRDRGRYSFALYGEPGADLLVLTSLCGSANVRGFETPYVHTSPEDAMLVFGDVATCGPAEEALPPTTMSSAIRATNALRAAGRAGAEACGLTGVERELLALEWDAWAVGGRWAHEWRLLDALTLAFGRLSGLELIGCIHEMHAYARIVWDVASAAGLRRHTVQHAVVASGKRWYFSTAEEREAGLALPDVMFAFSDHDRRLLAPWLPGTRLESGCSGRYAGWRDAESMMSPADGYILFAGALAGFDNDALFSCVRRYIDTGAPEGTARLRLHPFAVVSRSDRRWLETVTGQGIVELSHGVTLRDDLAGARAVVGMGTTVLMEGLLLGRPVVHVTNPDDHVGYIDLDGLAGVHEVKTAVFDASCVAEALGLEPSHREVRDRLGLDKPLVDYGRLFSESHTPDPEKEQ